MFGLSGEKEFVTTQDGEGLVRTDRHRSGGSTMGIALSVISGLAVRAKDLDI